MAYSLYQLLWFFLLYSFLGWCAGVAAAALRKHAFINTGFLNLPLCPIYGAAAVLFSIFLPELSSNLFFLFLGGMGALRLPHLCDRLPAGAHLSPEMVGFHPPPFPVRGLYLRAAAGALGVLWRCCASASAIPSSPGCWI